MPTATDSIALHSVLGHLSHLKSEVSAIVASERELIKHRAERHVTVRREIVQREEADEVRSARRLQEIAVEHHQSLDRAQAALVARNAKIHQAYHTSRTSLAHRAQEVKDRRIGLVQGSIMRDRQLRQHELEQAEEAHRSFLQLLSGDATIERELRKAVLTALRSYRILVDKRLTEKNLAIQSVGAAETSVRLRELLLENLADASQSVKAANRLPLAKFFRFIPLRSVMVVIACVQLLPGITAGGGGLMAKVPLLLTSEIALIAVWLVGLALSMATVRRAAETLAAARSLEDLAQKESSAQLAIFTAEIQQKHTTEAANLSEVFRESDTDWKASLGNGQRKLDLQLARMPLRSEILRQRKLEKIEAGHAAALEQAQRDASERTRITEISRQQMNSIIQSNVDSKIDALTIPWVSKVLPIFQALRELQVKSLESFPQWTQDICHQWSPPKEVPAAVRIGYIKVNPATLAGALPHDPRLEFGGEGVLDVPFALGFPDQGSLMIESDGIPDSAATQVLSGISLRLLASYPPGRASFVFIDPVGLGKDFAGLMHLADYEEALIHHRIWTQSTQIEERLAEINDHIEKVIQMYLRNEYADLAEYNQQAGTIAEKYRFIVIAGFPAAFSETSCKRLLSIATSGARCGVYLLLHRDLRQPLLDVALEDALRRACLRVNLHDGIFRLADNEPGADVIVFDPPPLHENAITLVHRIGKASIDSNLVQVPFSHIAPSAGELWKLETTDELRVPIGRTGAKKLQMLAIGKGTRQHMLVAGKTGSGKSTLFHVIITNLALWCSPEEVEFYLVDFKKGVEFKCYAAKRLPHAKVIAIESDREFALSVLQRIDMELKRRGELFRKVGSQDLAGYKRAVGSEPMPRSLLLIDEFQEFFTEDDAVAQEASLLLDRIVRQGRAFGIHVILGSQTLGGAYTLARATLGQMVIRVALQCNEADAHLIMDDDNPAPRLLTRPGEGIYNDQAGAVAANSPFQIVWLPENERDAMLDQINALASKDGKRVPSPIIFEGNVPADVRDNGELQKMLSSHPAARPATARVWLGAPNSIKGPTEAKFQRQSGSHLLVVGQAAERALSLLAISIVSLAAQFPRDQVEFVILDPHAYEHGEAGFFEKFTATLPHKIRIGGPVETPALLVELAAELEARALTSGRDASEVFLIVHGLQRFKVLRPGDDFAFSMDDDASAGPTPAQTFASLLNEGGPVGMHVLAATDTWNNVSRWIPRKLLAEFEMRVLFQMSANDSSNLIDSPAATSLGLHRALFYNEHFATLETFRPYAMPDVGWLDELHRSMGSAE